MFRRPTVGSSKQGCCLLKVSLRWQGTAFRNLAGVKDLAFTLCRGLLHTHSAQPTVVGQILGRGRLAGGGGGDGHFRGCVGKEQFVVSGQIHWITLGLML